MQLKSVCICVGSLHGSPTIHDEGWPEGSGPERMHIVWGMDCNTLLVSFWEQLPVLWLILDLSFCTYTCRQCSSGPYIGLCNLDPGCLCLGPLITSLRIEGVRPLSHQRAAVGVLPCNVSNKRMSASASPPGGFLRASGTRKQLPGLELLCYNM